MALPAEGSQRPQARPHHVPPRQAGPLLTEAVSCGEQSGSCATRSSPGWAFPSGPGVRGSPFLPGANSPGFGIGQHTPTEAPVCMVAVSWSSRGCPLAADQS